MNDENREFSIMSDMDAVFSYLSANRTTIINTMIIMPASGERNKREESAYDMRHQKEDDH
jgi:hypothetical protein